MISLNRLVFFSLLALFMTGCGGGGGSSSHAAAKASVDRVEIRLFDSAVDEITSDDAIQFKVFEVLTNGVETDITDSAALEWSLVAEGEDNDSQPQAARAGSEGSQFVDGPLGKLTLLKRADGDFIIEFTPKIAAENKTVVIAADYNGKPAMVVTGEGDALDERRLGIHVITPPPPTLDSLTVTPSASTISIPAGTSITVGAEAALSNGTDVSADGRIEWRVDNPAIASVDTSDSLTTSVVAIKEGVTSLTVAFSYEGKTKTVTKTLKVTSALLQAVTLGVAGDGVDGELELLEGGLTLGLTAEGSFTDGSSRDITKDVAWVSSNTQVANVNDDGMVTSGVPGESDISIGVSNFVTAADFSAPDAIVLRVVAGELIRIELQKATAVLHVGQGAQFTAKGIFHIRNVEKARDITKEVNWTSSDTTVVGVNNEGDDKGSVRGLRVGEATVSAVLGGQTAEVTVSVDKAVIQQVIINEGAIILLRGFEQQLTATGVYTNGRREDITTNTNLYWISNNSTRVQVSANGLVSDASFSSLGDATIRAEYQNGSDEGAVSDTVVVTLKDAELTAINITPQAQEVAFDDRSGVDYTAIGNFVIKGAADEDEAQPIVLNITDRAAWTSSNTNVATVNAGYARGKAEGSVVIKASYLGHEGEGSLSVTAGAADGIDPATLSRFQVVRVADGGLVAANEDKCVFPSKGNPGITSTSGPVLGTVLDPVVMAIPGGFYGQFRALAKLPNGETIDVTDLANWSADATFLSLDEQYTGRVHATADGQDHRGNVEVSIDGCESCNASQPVIVPRASSVLESIDITFDAATTEHGVPQQFCATGHFSYDGNSDGFQLPITTQVQWKAIRTGFPNLTIGFGILNDADNEGSTVPVKPAPGLKQNATVTAVRDGVIGETTEVSHEGCPFGGCS